MKHKNAFWGLFFITISIVIFGSALNLFMVGPTLFQLILTALLVVMAILSLPNLNFFGVIMPLIFAIIINKDILGLYRVNSWWLIWAGVFLAIGLQFLFKKQKTVQFYKFTEEAKDSFREEMKKEFGDTPKQDDYVDVEFEEVKQSTEENTDSSKKSDTSQSSHNDQYARIVNYSDSFASRTYYLNGEAVSQLNTSVNFGKTIVYADKASVPSSGLNIYIECNFGNVVLYLPKDARVINRVSSTLGHVKDHMRIAQAVDDKLIVIYGEVNFAQLEIHYV